MADDGYPLSLITAGEAARMLRPETQDFIETIREQLSDRRTLSDADEAALVMLASEWQDYWEAKAMVRARGVIITGMNQQSMLNPAIKTAQEAFRNVTALMREFGLTPKSRAGISTAKTEKKINSFAKFGGKK